MNFRQSVIWKDIFKVLNQKQVSYPVGDWKAILHTDIGDLHPIKISEIVIEKDFINEVSDKITISFLMDKGTYLSKVYPNLENLELTLYRYPITQQANNKPIKYDYKQRFKAIYLDKYNYRPKGTKDQMTSLTGTELLGNVTVNLQLMSLHVEPLRLRFIHGSYLGYTHEQLLNTVIKSSVDAITLPSGKCIDKFDIVKPDNNKPVQNLIVPSDTNILDFPYWLHHNMMGTYSTGLGTFVTKIKDTSTNKFNSHYFIYPTYSANEKNNSLILYTLPDTELNYNESTFQIKSKKIHIIGHIKGSYMENKQVDELKNGTGFRVPASHYYMQGYPNKFIKVDQKGPQGQYEKNNYKAVSKSRKDGFNLAVRQKEVSTANPYKYYSSYVAQTGNYLFYNWQQSDHSILTPSMPVTLNSLYGNTVNKETGILTGFTTVIQMRGKGILNQSGYTETTILKVYMTD